MQLIFVGWQSIRKTTTHWKTSSFFQQSCWEPITWTEKFLSRKVVLFRSNEMPQSEWLEQGPNEICSFLNPVKNIILIICTFIHAKRFFACSSLYSHSRKLRWTFPDSLMFCSNTKSSLTFGESPFSGDSSFISSPYVPWTACVWITSCVIWKGFSIKHTYLKKGQCQAKQGIGGIWAR